MKWSPYLKTKQLQISTNHMSETYGEHRKWDCLGVLKFDEIGSIYGIQSTYSHK